MEMVILIVHLLVCLCLIGLVLLQRSEGGALGMGGGGGGSLMSGRGAADALAKMTTVAGGFFLVTSLSLTVLSGAAASSNGTSVFDLIPSSEAPATTIAPPVEPLTDPAARPDPTESSAPEAAETQLASIGPAAAAAASDTGATRAGPLETRPTVAPTRSPAVVPASAPATTRPTPPPANRSGTGTTPTSASGTAAPATRAPVIPNTSGSIGGITLEDDGQMPAESIEIEPRGVEAVRRERAGPDQ